jgi:teichuronic acid biosynthesis glycosyltransferase TuaC
VLRNLAVAEIRKRNDSNDDAVFMRIVVAAEYYPRRADPVLGIWAHRQAMAARDAGAEVRVLVLHRLVPPRRAVRERDLGALAAPLRQPPRETRDGLSVTYVPFVSPAFGPRAVAGWGAWAAPPLGVALRALRRRFAFDLIHAHYAVPTADAVRRTRPAAPVVVSVHGGDVLWTARRSERGREAVTRSLAAAELVLANSRGTATRSQALGARATRVVHLGTDLPARRREPHPEPTVVTVGHLVERKRHADVLRALPARVRYVVVGDGPERPALEALARELGRAERTVFTGALPHEAALAEARRAHAFVLPSVDEAFGVAYVEAMAGWVPAIGLRGEDGPEEIAAAGGGIVLVPPGDLEALTTELARLLENEGWREELGRAARTNVARHFTWERCGADTVAAYAEALRT